MKMEQYCQSCGMPLEDEKVLGTNKDKSKNGEYCCYCYADGAFTDNRTMEEMIDFCLDLEKDSGLYDNREEARKQMMEWYPTLRRWAAK